jgi:hypothetical protein
VVLVANLSALLVPPPGLWPFRILAGAAAGMAVGAGNAIIARSVDPDRLYGLSATLATAFSAMARYTKITVNPDAVDRCFVHLFGPGHPTAPAEITRDLDATDDPVHGVQEGRFVQGYYGHSAVCRCTSVPASTCCVRACSPAAWTQVRARRTSSRATCA